MTRSLHIIGSRQYGGAEHFFQRLVGALNRPSVWYMHGEMSAPKEPVVHGAERTLVPRPETADVFMTHGVAPSRLLVTGSCPARAGLGVSGIVSSCKFRTFW